MPNQDTQKVENSGAKPQAGAVPDSGKPSLWSGRWLQFWLFCVLLALALIGMGLTQATQGGGARYWLILLWIYALFSLMRAWLQARKRHESIWSDIHLHLFHWLGALIALHIVFVLERHDILSRDASSNVSMVILALSSYLAGLHFERMFLLIGLVLAIMAVVGAFVEQYTLWLILGPSSLIAVWLFFKSKHALAGP
ncbi:MAG: hypothetical protein LJE70_17290 [Chromatiaceae bacterium]|nr:hypothetical protein [Chromatiaceae bacterium]